MIALDPAIAAEFNTTLARAKLDALNVLRALIAAPANDAALPPPHQRLAATQILRTTFITHSARNQNSPSPSGAWEGAGGRDTKSAHQPINHPAAIEAHSTTTTTEPPRNQNSPWNGAGSRHTQSAQSIAPPQPTPTIHPDDIDELAQRLSPEEFLDLLESLPGGTVLGESPEVQAHINARLLHALQGARDQPRGPPRPR